MEPRQFPEATALAADEQPRYSAMISYTKGPWERARRAETHAYVIQSEHVLIARMVGTWDEAAANAQLIAAAPELAEQLHMLLCLLDVDKFPIAFDKAEAVLKKSGYTNPGFANAKEAAK